MKAILHDIKFKVLCVILSVAMLFGASGECIKADSSNWNTNYTYVFVHGLSGWGSYDPVYKVMPYWGMFGGDLMKYLNKKGFNVCCASVAPSGSAWDRACELYAELTGTIVDYGKEHSERCGHERFGADYTGRALVEKFDEENKINILGHSFGGATVRMFASIMEKGSDAEKAVTDEADLSPYFEGGKGSWIYSLTSLAAPHNGTTAYCEGAKEPVREPSALDKLIGNMMNMGTKPEKDGRVDYDYADYDMHIDNALELNKQLSVFDETYYFSYACSSTIKQDDGTYLPDNKSTEILFRTSAEQLGRYTGVTEGGFVIGEEWLENDGLVNTYSAKAPLGAPQKDFEEGNVQKGIWNIMPVYSGDHMSLEGGFFIVNDIKDLYSEHLSMINSL